MLRIIEQQNLTRHGAATIFARGSNVGMCMMAARLILVGPWRCGMITKIKKLVHGITKRRIDER